MASLNVNAVVFQPGTDGPSRQTQPTAPLATVPTAATSPTDPLQASDPWSRLDPNAMGNAAARAQQAQYQPGVAATSAQGQGGLWQGYRPLVNQIDRAPTSNPPLITTTQPATVVQTQDSSLAPRAATQPAPSAASGQQLSLAHLLGWDVVPTPPQASSPNSQAVPQNGDPAPSAGNQTLDQGVPAHLAAPAEQPAATAAPAEPAPTTI